VIASIAAALGIAIPLAATGFAQPSPRGHETAGADSARVVRNARNAQSSFEAFRRARLPHSDGGYGPCELRIGRYCYWRDDDETPPPPEPQSIRERRQHLLAVLDSAATTLPGDRWIAGQRARYIAEIGDTARARVAVEQCSTGKSWCAALAGYLAHVAGAYVDAAASFERSLAAMDSVERCRWMDISMLLYGDVAKRYEALDCAGRERMARRLFALGAPLYSVAATDLFTEHLARYARTQIAEGAATTNGDHWADDARELTLRFGWPLWYSQTTRSVMANAEPSVTGHDPSRPYYLFPSLRALDHPGLASDDDWQLADIHAPSGYATAAARSIHTLPYQLARFRHGDSTVIVAAWDASKDISIGRDAEGALAVTDDDSVVAVVRVIGAGRSGTTLATIAGDSGLASVEVLDRAAHHAARVRVGFAPPVGGRVLLSDLLVYRPWGATSPTALDSVLTGQAMRTNEVRGRDSVGVFWEAYGLRASGDVIRYRLSVEQIGVSWARRAAERLRLADRSSAVRVEWSEVPTLENGRASRGVRVDLSRLRAGRYRMELNATVRDGSTATAVREIVVR
jgi:hypothetical protein